MSRSPSPNVVDPPTSAAPTINTPETSAFTSPKTTTSLASNDSYYLELANEAMANRFVGPMPVDEFLNKFLPPPADLPPSPCMPTDRIFDDMFILNGEPHALFVRRAWRFLSTVNTDPTDLATSRSMCCENTVSVLTLSSLTPITNAIATIDPCPAPTSLYTKRTRHPRSPPSSLP